MNERKRRYLDRLDFKKTNLLTEKMSHKYNTNPNLKLLWDKLCQMTPERWYVLFPETYRQYELDSDLLDSTINKQERGIKGLRQEKHNNKIT